MLRSAWIFVGIALMVSYVGCQPAAQTTPPPAAGQTADDHDDHGHAHDESHPAHGPNGGHIFTLGDADFAGEGVTYKSNNRVAVFIVDKEGKTNKPVKAEKVVVKTTLAGGKSFELAAVEPDADGLSAEYRLDDEELSNFSTTSPTVEVTVDGTTYTGKLSVHKMN